MSSSVPRPAVIFDLDGTLVDSLDDITNSLNYAAGIAGIGRFTRDQVSDMVGDGVVKLIARASGLSDEQFNGRFLKSFMEHYIDHCVDLTYLYPHIDVQLDWLVEAGWDLAVLSNKPDALTKRCCEVLLKRWPFASHTGASETVARKPNPAEAKAIARRLDRSPEDVFFVGDSLVDIEVAKAAGMVSVAVGWGFRKEAVLKSADPDIFVSEPQDLADALLNYEI